jgi:hypothetical protein
MGQNTPEAVKRIMEDYYHALKDEEKQFLKQVAEQLKNHPLWEWCERVKGLGQVACLTFLGFINPYEADTAGKAKAYFGLIPGVRLKSGEKANVNLEAKGRIWLVTRNVIMQRDNYYYPLFLAKVRKERKIFIKGYYYCLIRGNTIAEEALDGGNGSNRKGALWKSPFNYHSRNAWCSEVYSYQHCLQVWSASEVWLSRAQNAAKHNGKNQLWTATKAQRAITAKRIQRLGEDRRKEDSDFELNKRARQNMRNGCFLPTGERLRCLSNEHQARFDGERQRRKGLWIGNNNEQDFAERDENSQVCRRFKEIRILRGYSLHVRKKRSFLTAKKEYYLNSERQVFMDGKWVKWPPFKEIIANPKLCPKFEECVKKLVGKAEKLGRKPKPPPCRLHVDSMAKRWLAALLVSHAAMLMRQAEGLDVTNYLAHRGFIPPKP